MRLIKDIFWVLLGIQFKIFKIALTIRTLISWWATGDASW